MMLQPEDRREFFRIWLGLLAFVNEKYELVKRFGHPKSPVGIKLENIVKIKGKLWQDVNIIDEYIEDAQDLSEDKTQILTSWKNSIPGHFFIMKHLKNYAVFLHEHENESFLYGVHGISNPISELFLPELLPRMVETTIMPFKGIIIYDTIFQSHNVSIDPNMRGNLNLQYSETKKNKGIITGL